MNINDILREQVLEEEIVFSSWIDDLTLQSDGDILMSLDSGRSYIIERAGEDVFNEWINAGSKGKFWHSDIKDRYYVNRVR